MGSIVHAEKPATPSTKAEVFFKNGKKTEKAAEVVFKINQNRVTYEKRLIAPSEKGAAHYESAFQRDIGSDSLGITQLLASSLRYAAQIGVYSEGNHIPKTRIFLGDLERFDRKYAVFSPVAAAVKSNIYSNPMWSTNKIIIPHEVWHMLDPTPHTTLNIVISEGGADLFARAFVSRNVRERGDRAYEILKRYFMRYEEGDGLFSIPLELANNIVTGEFDWSDQRSTRELGKLLKVPQFWGGPPSTGAEVNEIYKAGMRLASVSLLTSEVDVGKSLLDFFSSKTTSEFVSNLRRDISERRRSAISQLARH